MKWYELKSQETFLRSVRRNPRAHYSLHIEAVHLSDTGRLCPGYRTLDDLVNAGRIKVQENGLVEVVW